MKVSEMEARIRISMFNEFAEELNKRKRLEEER
jgi:hypothetical protein